MPELVPRVDGEHALEHALGERGEVALLRVQRLDLRRGRFVLPAQVVELVLERGDLGDARVVLVLEQRVLVLVRVPGERERTDAHCEHADNGELDAGRGPRAIVPVGHLPPDIGRRDRLLYSPAPLGSRAAV